MQAEVNRHPDDTWARFNLVLADAGAGRRGEALAEAERVRAAFRPVPKSPTWAAYISTLFQIDLISGNTAGAVAWVDTLLHLPGTITPASLKIDPTFATLRGDPKFQKLMAQK